MASQPDLNILAIPTKQARVSFTATRRERARCVRACEFARQVVYGSIMPAGFGLYRAASEGQPAVAWEYLAGPAAVRLAGPSPSPR